MNKNITSILNSPDPSRSKSTNNDQEGRSEFTRHKLQKQYQPKTISYKHKLPKTTEQEKDALLRIQKQKDQEIVAVNALECFKKGQLINIDWKTKTNFRKSQASYKLPRLKTQTLDLKNTKLLDFQSNRSLHFSDKRSKSLKNQEIQEKRNKLKQLLYPKKTDRYNRMRNFMTDNQEMLFENRSSIISESKSGDMFKSITINNQLPGQTQNLITYLNDHSLIKEKDKLLNFAYMRSQTQEMKNLSQFSDQFLQRSVRDNSLNPKPKGIESYINDSSSIQDKSEQINRNSVSNMQSEALPSESIVPLKKNSEAKNHENYDILNDPQIYLLISKSRDRIISWKESCILDSMNQVERLKFQQEAANRSPAKNQKKEKERALSLDTTINRKTAQKAKMLQKIEDKKRINSQKLSKNFGTRVLTETQQFLRQTSLRNTANHSQIYTYLGMKSPESAQKKCQKLFKPKQSLIRQKKKSSLIEVQEKLLKRVKLSFLKQDLTKKFQQIRAQQSDSALRSS